MRMSYVLKSRDRNKNSIFKKILIGVFITFCVAIVLLFAPSIFVGSILTSSTPLWKVGNVIESDVSTNLGFFRSKMSLIQENQALKISLEEIRMKEVAYDALKEEYDTLKSLFGRIKPEGFILAGVLVRPPQAPYDNLIVDAGSEEGVRVGDVVFANDTVILGDVVEVYEHQAKVELYSTAGKKITGFISRTGVEVGVEGRGGGDFEISVPKDAIVNESDIFVTAGVSGYVVASVVAIDSKPTEAFQRVLAQSLASMSQIRWVAIRRE